jgi:hypothetical protein
MDGIVVVLLLLLRVRYNYIRTSIFMSDLWYFLVFLFWWFFILHLVEELPWLHNYAGRLVCLSVFHH